MKGHIYKPNCKCSKPKDPKEKKKCTCRAKWGFMVDAGINPQTGKRRQKFKGGFSTRKEAESAAAAFQTELSRGTHIEEKNITFKDFAAEWLKLYEATGKVKISTIRVRQHEINRLMPSFEYLKMKDITKKQYQDMLNDLKGADNTLDGIHRTGRMIFKKAVELDVIKIDPTQYATVPKSQRTVEEIENKKEIPKFLEKEELALFLKTAQEKGLEGDYLIFLTLAYSGIRDGELCCLKKTDFNEDEYTLSITKTYYNPNNNILKYTLLPPKTVTSERKIELDPIVFAELEKHLAKQNEVKMRYRKTYHDKDFVFANTNKEYAGYPVYIKFIENRMRRLLKLAGLNQSLTPHSFRHSHCSLLAEASVPLQDIMDRLGHKDDEQTKHVYLHVTKTKKKEASHKFSELMRNLSVK